MINFVVKTRGPIFKMMDFPSNRLEMPHYCSLLLIICSDFLYSYLLVRNFRPCTSVDHPYRKACSQREIYQSPACMYRERSINRRHVYTKTASSRTDASAASPGRFPPRAAAQSLIFSAKTAEKEQKKSFKTHLQQLCRHPW